MQWLCMDSSPPFVFLVIIIKVYGKCCFTHKVNIPPSSQNSTKAWACYRNCVKDGGIPARSHITSPFKVNKIRREREEWNAEYGHVDVLRARAVWLQWMTGAGAEWAVCYLVMVVLYIWRGGGREWNTEHRNQNDTLHLTNSYITGVLTKFNRVI